MQYSNIPSVSSFLARIGLAALLLAPPLALNAKPILVAKHAQILPPKSNAYGKSYAEWSAAWWQWAMSQPVAGHPFVDDPAFDVAAGQSGQVWFLATPFGTVERTCTIPPGKALFVGLLNAEGSDLEDLGATEEEQRAYASFITDHAVNLSCELDGVSVRMPEKYRVASPQFSFMAPSPWIFGSEGGIGTSVADGYYLMCAPLSPGAHTLHYRGAFHFAIAEGDPFDFDAELDVTYHLNAQ